jgi:hypothetical protein
VPATAGGATVFEQWLYETRWLKAPDPMAAERVTGGWLVLADRRGFGDALAAALRARGEACTTVPADAPCRRRRTVVREPRRAALRGVVHLFSLDADSGDLQRATLSRAARHARESAPLVGQALACATARTPRLWLVAGRGGRAGPDRRVGTRWNCRRRRSGARPASHSNRRVLGRSRRPRSGSRHARRPMRSLATFSTRRRKIGPLRGSERLVQRLARCLAGPFAPLVLRPDASYP